MFHVRVDDKNDAHVRLTVFANGANCGKLCMKPGEATRFLLDLKPTRITDPFPDGAKNLANARAWDEQERDVAPFAEHWPPGGD